ncbi:MAG: HEAT repeat protein [Pirellulaceae bacterium]|jgi:HEAT repeat protein
MPRNFTRRLVLYGVGTLLTLFLVVVAVLSLRNFQVRRIDSTSDVDTLITALEHKNVNIRHAAISALRKMGPQAVLAIPALTRALKDEDAGVRYRAADTLGSLGTLANEASISLVSAVRDEDERVRRSAAMAINGVDPTAHTNVPHLIKILQNRNPDVRVWAADALGAIALDGVDASAAIPQLRQCLSDDDRDVRLRAVRAVTSIDEPDATCVPALIEAFKSDDENTRIWAFRALGSVGPDAKSAVPALVKVIEYESDGEVCLTAINALGSIGVEAAAAAPALIDALTKSNVRFAAERALEHIGAPVIPAVVDALKSNDDRLSLSAARILERLGGTAVPALVELLSGSEEEIRTMASSTLQAIGVDAVPALMAELDTDDNDIRTHVEHVLSEIGKEAVPKLLELLTDEDLPLDVRRRTIYALGVVGVDAEAAIPMLIQQLHHENHGIRESAIGAIRQVGKLALPSLRKLEESFDIDVRGRAVLLIAELSPLTRSSESALFEILSGNDLELRIWAAGCQELLEQKSPKTLELLERILRDPTEDGKLRGQACYAIAKLHSDSTQLLIEVINNENDNVAACASLALKSKGPTAISPLITVLKSADLEASLSASNVLGEIGAAAVSALIDVLKNENLEAKVRQRAAKTLGKIAAAGTALGSLLKNSEKDVADLAQSALDINESLRNENMKNN